MIKAELEKINQSITKVITTGTLIISATTTLSLAILGLLSTDSSAISMSLVCLAIATYSAVILVIHKLGYYRIGSVMMVVLYACLSTALLLSDKLGSTPGYMLLGITIFIVSATLQTKYIISAACAAVLLALLVLFAKGELFDQPELTIINSGTLLVFGLMSWLGNSKILSLIRRVSEAEKSLEIRNQQLESMLEKETALLKDAKLTESTHLYLFAKIGQTSVSLMHDLINNLSILKMDIESLARKDTLIKSSERVKESIEYIVEMAREAKKCVTPKEHYEMFDVLEVLDKEIIKFKKSKRSKYLKIISKIPKDRQVIISGNPRNLIDTISTIMNNSYDACRPDEYSVIRIEAGLIDERLVISVSDSGSPIKEDDVAYLFAPRESAKVNGMGMGLYLAKSIIESQFEGEILYTNKPDKKFIIKIPVSI